MIDFKLENSIIAFRRVSNDARQPETQPIRSAHVSRATQGRRPIADQSSSERKLIAEDAAAETDATNQSTKG